jgi:hypothetical protein
VTGALGAGGWVVAGTVAGGAVVGGTVAVGTDVDGGAADGVVAGAFVQALTPMAAATSKPANLVQRMSLIGVLVRVGGSRGRR